MKPPRDPLGDHQILATTVHLTVTAEQYFVKDRRSMKTDERVSVSSPLRLSVLMPFPFFIKGRLGC